MIIDIFLKKEAQKYRPDLVPSVLACFSDPDSRVRYYACESLYNIVKVLRSNVLIYFNEIFDGLCRVCKKKMIRKKTILNFWYIFLNSAVLWSGFECSKRSRATGQIAQRYSDRKFKQRKIWYKRIHAAIERENLC